jgi:hypothetical protein
MQKSFKIIGRNPKTNLQVKKRVYTSEADYLKYKDKLIKRYKSYLNVECYELQDEWTLINKEPCNKSICW